MDPGRRHGECLRLAAADRYLPWRHGYSDAWSHGNRGGGAYGGAPAGRDGARLDRVAAAPLTAPPDAEVQQNAPAGQRFVAFAMKPLVAWQSPARTIVTPITGGCPPWKHPMPRKKQS